MNMHQIVSKFNHCFSGDKWRTKTHVTYNSDKWRARGE